ncbi:MAG: TonB-dependent receptor plug domain-containing protein, partial [Bacteroidales bacterium]|nr:TonB-dependent receptor plug domain-containing protein [Bacteroidales bacterium]
MDKKIVKQICGLCLLAFLFLFPSGASAQDVRVTLDEQNASLKTVIEKIESQTRYLFAVEEGVDVGRTITVKVTNASLRSALDKVASSADLVYSVNGMNIILSKKVVAKPSVVSGQVIDEAGLAIPGVSVFIGGTPVGTVTDVDGRFTLDVPAEYANSQLQFNSLGYEVIELPVSGRTVFNVVLRESMAELDQSIVTALGIKRSERAVTYNVQSLDDNVFKTREANMVNSLQGKLAGVQINSSAAGVGGETKVVMRGAKSISSDNNALYVLDGIPLPSLSMTVPGDNYSVYNGSAVSGDGISNFNADDIANMSALVGPSAAALYGYKAANGVLMLTTRTAEKGISLTYGT